MIQKSWKSQSELEVGIPKVEVGIPKVEVGIPKVEVGIPKVKVDNSCPTESESY